VLGEKPQIVCLRKKGVSRDSKKNTSSWQIHVIGAMEEKNIAIVFLSEALCQESINIKEDFQTQDITKKC